MKKILISLAALAVIPAAMAGTAEAKTHINVGLNLGGPGVYVGSGYGYGYAEPVYYYDEDPGCGYETVKVVKWKNGHKIVKWKKHWVCG